MQVSEQLNLDTSLLPIPDAPTISPAAARTPAASQDGTDLDVATSSAVRHSITTALSRADSSGPRVGTAASPLGLHASQPAPRPPQDAGRHDNSIARHESGGYLGAVGIFAKAPVDTAASVGSSHLPPGDDVGGPPEGGGRPSVGPSAAASEARKAGGTRGGGAMAGSVINDVAVGVVNTVIVRAPCPAPLALCSTPEIFSRSLRHCPYPLPLSQAHTRAPPTPSATRAVAAGVGGVHQHSVRRGGVQALHPCPLPPPHRLQRPRAARRHAAQQAALHGGAGARPVPLSPPARAETCEQPLSALLAAHCPPCARVEHASRRSVCERVAVGVQVQDIGLIFLNAMTKDIAHRMDGEPVANVLGTAMLTSCITTVVIGLSLFLVGRCAALQPCLRVPMHTYLLRSCHNCVVSATRVLASVSVLAHPWGGGDTNRFTARSPL